MSFSFSINAKSQSNRLKKPSNAAAGSPSVNYVSEFRSDEPPLAEESKIKPIAPIPNAWRPNKKLKNLHTLPPISKPDGEDAAVQFELDPGSNPEPTDTSTGYGLNLREPSAAVSVAPNGNYETISDMELRRLREDLGNLPDGPGLDEFEDVPVEGFGAALLSGYGWKEGRGIGRNAKEDVKVAEVTRKRDRGGLGFSDELPEPEKPISTNGNAGVNPVTANGKGEKMKGLKEKDTKGFVKEKEVMIVNGREMGMKGRIMEVRNDGDLLVVRMSKSNEKVKVRSRDVVEVGSAGEEKCIRKLKELRVKESDMRRDKSDRNIVRRIGQEKLKARSERVDWLRNHIRVRIISQELKGGRLYLKKGVVMDVVGPGVCDISVDESRELVQGVDQDLLETALPKRGGPVLVLCGRHKGVYGTLLERDSEKETGLVRDADTHELLNVKLEQVAEYTGDPSDIGY
ncbi:protein MOS2-like [Salvia divinorum]|uniref:Protein MOS2-like n=1 Tax=Salvia divinorum TaxID=28513 RepID=A0ABD1FKJ1_SALDI